MEKVFVIPLRQAFRAPRTKRARRAMELVRMFLSKHLKSKEVIVGTSINETVWSRGMEKVPRRVRVHAEKDDKGVVRAEIMGVEIKAKVAKPEKKEEGVKLEEVKEAPKVEEKKAPAQAEATPKQEPAAKKETKK